MKLYKFLDINPTYGTSYVDIGGLGFASFEFLAYNYSVNYKINGFVICPWLEIVFNFLLQRLPKIYVSNVKF